MQNPKLDNRPIPEWYDQAKFGIFLHWGVYSVPAYDDPNSVNRRKIKNGAEWYLGRLNDWRNTNSPTIRFHNATYGSNFRYIDFGPMFTAEKWNPAVWVNYFKECGAKYLVITAKHHDGFTLWPAPNSKDDKTGVPWNSVENGPRRDILGILRQECAKQGLIFGVYYSLLQWNRNSRSQKYVRETVFPQLKDLVIKYEPQILWLDGDWDGDENHWRTTEFLTWLYNQSPVAKTIVVNDRQGKNTHGLRGDFYNFEDRYQPPFGQIPDHKWESAMTIGNSWGYNQYQPDNFYKDPAELIRLLIRTVAYGGNFLLNLGPTLDGGFDPKETERLTEIGTWLKYNGEGIYLTKPYAVVESKDGIFFTVGEKCIYALIPMDNRSPRIPFKYLKIELLPGVGLESIEDLTRVDFPKEMKYYYTLKFRVS